jgi:hypothetical protein
MTDAIKRLQSVVNHFKEIIEIAVTGQGHLVVFYQDDFSKQRITFIPTQQEESVAIQLLEWCEGNLTENK